MNPQDWIEFKADFAQRFPTDWEWLSKHPDAETRTGGEKVTSKTTTFGTQCGWRYRLRAWNTACGVCLTTDDRSWPLSVVVDALFMTVTAPTGFVISSVDYNEQGTILLMGANASASGSIVADGMPQLFTPLIFDEGPMDVCNDVGPGQRQHVVVAEEIARVVGEELASVVGLDQTARLDARTHGAVEHHDPLGDGLTEFVGSCGA